MIHVGAMGGIAALVPTSSSTRNATRSQLSALAAGLPSSNRSMMKHPVLQYHAWSAFHLLGRDAGHEHLTAPSAWCCASPSLTIGFCRTNRMTSPSGATSARYFRNVIVFS